MRLRLLCCVLLCAATACTVVGSACAQVATLSLWPSGNPEPGTVTGPEFDPSKDSERLLAGRPVVRVTNVTHPMLSVYTPQHAANTGAAALVFPGGSYLRLAIQAEGTEVCDWLTSIGVTCVLVKYRVPEDGHYPENVADLEDAQQAMRLTRSHAAEWHIDPARVGVIGFSAGAHLAVALSTHPEFQSRNVPASSLDARPAFQMVLYPGWLSGPQGTVNPALQPTAKTPPTFLVQAENDYTAHVENALIYFQALKQAGVPAELHLFAEGGHGFGLRPTELPITHWPALAETWLRTIHMLGAAGQGIEGREAASRQRR
ncbi:MAG: alpha/beta hydrolase [Acidobacteriota bacterium]|nr:alpha/beta hydrolase [Acidobacteriota bacterium]